MDRPQAEYREKSRSGPSGTLPLGRHYIPRLISENERRAMLRPFHVPSTGLDFPP